MINSDPFSPGYHAVSGTDAQLPSQFPVQSWQLTLYSPGRVNEKGASALGLYGSLFFSMASF